MKLNYSPKAVTELNEIYKFLCLYSDRAATTMHNEILDEIDRLLSFPQMGPIEPLLAEEPEMFRSLVVCRHYKVIYLVENEIINIMDVWDCRRNPKALKRGMKKQK